MSYIRSSYINTENPEFVNFIHYDQDEHLKIMEQLISNTHYTFTPPLQTDCFPVMPFEMSCMTPVVQPIIPPTPQQIQSQQQLKNKMIVNKTENVDIIGNENENETETDDEIKHSRRKLTNTKLTDEEYKTRRKLQARESARRARKKKNDFIKEQKMKLEILEKKNRLLRLELERIKNQPLIT